MTDTPLTTDTLVTEPTWKDKYEHALDQWEACKNKLAESMKARESLRAKAEHYEDANFKLRCGLGVAEERVLSDDEASMVYAWSLQLMIHGKDVEVVASLRGKLRAIMGADQVSKVEQSLGVTEG